MNWREEFVCSDPMLCGCVPSPSLRSSFSLHHILVRYYFLLSLSVLPCPSISYYFVSEMLVPLCLYHHPRLPINTAIAPAPAPAPPPYPFQSFLLLIVTRPALAPHPCPCLMSLPLPLLLPSPPEVVILYIIE